MRPTLLCLLLVLGCRAVPDTAAEVSPTLYEVDNQISTAGPDARQVADLIAPYKQQLDGKMNRVLATVATPLEKGRPESTLGNWVADLVMAAAVEVFPDRRIAFATQNQGGLRVDGIREGPLLVAEVYELMPFDNELVLVELSGAELLEFIDHIASSGGWPLSREISLAQRENELSVRIGGELINDNATYSVATADYVANGGSDASMLVGKPQLKSNRKIRDLLIEQAERSPGGVIDVKSTGERFKIN